MKHVTFELLTPTQQKLFGQQWTPSQQPARAVVCLHHGIGDHSGRYEGLVNHLVDHQYAVVAIDQIGHGHSDGQRGHVRQYDDLLDNIDLLIEKARLSFPGLPLFLLGHSWGGNLALNYAMRRKPDLRGVIAMSPWLKLGFEPPAWKVWLGHRMSHIFPAFSQANGLPIQFVSRDSAVIEAYLADPLTHDRISARLFDHSYAAAEWALAHASQFPLPLLLIHGDQDKLTSPQGSQEFARRLPGKSTLRLFKDRYHETHNDWGKEEVFETITHWLDEQLANG